MKQICFVTRLIHDSQTIQNNDNLLAIKLYGKMLKAVEKVNKIRNFKVDSLQLATTFKT